MPIASFRKTYGERKVAQLLQALPKEDFFHKAEPRINLPSGKVSKPDFVIVLRQYGVVTLEVKDWVSIEAGNTESVTICKKDGETSLERNPVLTAEQYAYDLNELFEQYKDLHSVYRGKQRLKFPWQYAVVLTNTPNHVIQQFEERGIWDRGVVLGSEDLTSAQLFRSKLENLPWRWGLKGQLDNATLDVIREVLDPSLMVMTAAGEHKGTITILQENLIKEPIPALEPQQTSFLENQAPDGISVRLVRGVAGSGKTLILVQRALYLAEKYPHGRVLVLTFNKDLAHDLQTKIAHPEIEVTNFHKLCHDLLGKLWCSPQPVGNWLRQFDHEIWAADLTREFVMEEIKWRKDMELFDDEAYLGMERKGRGTKLLVDKRRVVNEIFRRYIAHQEHQKNHIDWEDVPLRTYEYLLSKGQKDQALYDVILIDEAQDFAPTWFKVINLLLKPSGLLFICDDPAQSLFRYYSWREKGVEVVGRTRVLRVPFRCTRQISQAAHSLLTADAILSHDEEITSPDFRSRELSGGEMPYLLRSQNVEAQVRWVEQMIEEYLEAGISPNDIAILYPSWDLEAHWDHFSRKGIYTTHFDKMKGLEFKVVFIPNVEIPFMDMNADIRITKLYRRLFTAMTRARDLLTMLYVGTLPAALEPLLPYVVSDDCPL